MHGSESRGKLKIRDGDRRMFGLGLVLSQLALQTNWSLGLFFAGQDSLSPVIHFYSRSLSDLGPWFYSHGKNHPTSINDGRLSSERARAIRRLNVFWGREGGGGGLRFHMAQVIPALSQLPLSSASGRLHGSNRMALSPNLEPLTFGQPLYPAVWIFKLF